MSLTEVPRVKRFPRVGHIGWSVSIDSRDSDRSRPTAGEAACLRRLASQPAARGSDEAFCDRLADPARGDVRRHAELCVEFERDACAVRRAQHPEGVELLLGRMVCKSCEFYDLRRLDDDREKKCKFA